MFAAEMGAKDFDFDKHEAEVCGGLEPNLTSFTTACAGNTASRKIIAKSEPYEGFEMAKINVVPSCKLVNWPRWSRSRSGESWPPSDFSLILFSISVERHGANTSAADKYRRENE